MPLCIGEKAPAFSLPSDKNTTISLEDYLGKKLILYFYPKDDTPGCTKEACEFRDNWQTLKNLNVEVVGISKDNVKSHQKFKQKYGLPFTLLSDPEHKICEAYEVWVDKKFMGKKYKGIERSTFLIDEQGNIADIWRNVKVKTHVEEILQALK